MIKMNNKTAFLPMLLLAFLIVAFASQAIAQAPSANNWPSDFSPGDVSDRLERLERDIQTLNQQLSRMPIDEDVQKQSFAIEAQPSITTAPSAIVTPNITHGIKEEDLPEGVLDRILVRISRLEEEVREATNGMERVDHRFGLIETRLDTISGDVDFRLSRIESASGGAPQRRAGDAAVKRQS